MAAVRPGEQGLKAVGVVLDEDQVCAGDVLDTAALFGRRGDRRREDQSTRPPLAAVALDLDHHLHLWATCRPKFLRTIYTRRTRLARVIPTDDRHEHDRD